MLVSMALCPRYLIRMRPLVQVQPGPPHPFDLRKYLSDVAVDRSCLCGSPAHSGLGTHSCTAVLGMPGVEGRAEGGGWSGQVSLTQRRRALQQRDARRGRVALLKEFKPASLAQRCVVAAGDDP